MTNGLPAPTGNEAQRAGLNADGSRVAGTVVYLVMKDTSDFDSAEEVQFIASTKEKAEEFISGKRSANSVYSVVEWAVDK